MPNKEIHSDQKRRKNKPFLFSENKRNQARKRSKKQKQKEKCARDMESKNKDPFNSFWKDGKYKYSIA